MNRNTPGPFFTQLATYIARLGWYGGKLQLSFTLEGQFEGFSGRASETWEQQWVLKITSNLTDTGCNEVNALLGLTSKNESLEMASAKLLAQIQNIKNGLPKSP